MRSVVVREIPETGLPLVTSNAASCPVNSALWTFSDARTLALGRNVRRIQREPGRGTACTASVETQPVWCTLKTFWYKRLKWLQDEDTSNPEPKVNEM